MDHEILSGKKKPSGKMKMISVGKGGKKVPGKEAAPAKGKAAIKAGFKAGK